MVPGVQIAMDVTLNCYKPRSEFHVIGIMVAGTAQTNEGQVLQAVQVPELVCQDLALKFYTALCQKDIVAIWGHSMASFLIELGLCNRHVRQLD